MARERDPNRDKAYEIWKQHEGNITNREIANLLSTDEKKIAVWKQRDKWNVVQQPKTKKDNVVQQKKKTSKKSRSPSRNKTEEFIVDNDELTDKQSFFCMYYLKYYNATKAYQKAYGCAYSTAMVEGHKHLRNPKIMSEIERLKSLQQQDIFLDGKAVLQKYIDIAFADIADYVSFGRREQQVIGMYGPVFEKDEYGDTDETKPLMETVNYVDLKESSIVDGSIVTEVKQGKDGVSVKLADKMKALDFLSKYTDLLNENDRKKLQDEKAKMDIEKTKADIARIKGEEDPTEDDGFIDALKAETEEVWTDDDEA